MCHFESSNFKIESVFGFDPKVSFCSEHTSPTSLCGTFSLVSDFRKFFSATKQRHTNKDSRTFLKFSRTCVNSLSEEQPDVFKKRSWLKRSHFTCSLCRVSRRQVLGAGSALEGTCWSSNTADKTHNTYTLFKLQTSNMARSPSVILGQRSLWGEKKKTASSIHSSRWSSTSG